jgi:hypothetical protein
LRTTERRALILPIVTGQKTVVYSQQLAGLERGEQLAVRAWVRTSTANLGYPARVTTEIVLASDPAAANPGAEAKRVVPDSPQICRGNGFNCLPADSPATSRKAGSIRIVRDARVPLYANVVVTTGDPLRRAAPGHALSVLDGGFLEVVRYPAELEG